MMEYRIWANHAHVFPEASKPGATPEELKKLMADCGIEKAVCFTCFRDQYERSGLSGDPVEWVYEQTKNDPSLIPFGTVDFDRDDITYQVERIAGLGMKGIKIHPAYQEIHILGGKAKECYAAAEKNGLFLSFHTGIHWHRISEYDPLLFDEIAWFYPELKFSMEHIGGYHFFTEALAVMCNNSRRGGNVYGGWTTVAIADDGIPGTWSLSDEQLRTVIKQTGNFNSIFGLDFPYNKTEYTQKAIDRIKNLEIPEEAKEGILGGNLRRVLGME